MVAALYVIVRNMFQPKLQGRERILLYGGTSTSKTYSWLNIAKWHQRTNSPARFYCLDTDNAVIDQLESEFSDLTNVTVNTGYEYGDYILWLENTLRKVKPEDWLVVDMLGEYWDACQRYFVEQVHGKSQESYFLAMRKEMEDLKDKPKGFQQSNPLEGRYDWPYINKLNKGFMDNLLLRNRCHIFATSKADALNPSNEEKENLDVYARFGLKPHGQKFIGHYFKTIILTGRPQSDFVLNTVKDRGREELKGTKVTDFSLTYLKNIAGWTL